jgi:radical SAM superfamily enzyme YgiQ (UPF0313 family)
MRILLISPRSEFLNGTPGWLLVPQMSLLILEALTGDEHRVRIVEEELEPVPMDGCWDMVGITAMTATANRAYRLADEFRARGVKVVLGGVHASVMPQEASEHADAVAVGEAEAVWARILEDAQANRLARFYFNSKPEEMAVPLVRYRFAKKGSSAPRVDPVVASRGCPNGCEFCCVPQVYGHRVRRLPIGRVVEQVRRSRAGYVAFLDDNLTGNREFAMELFSVLQPLGIKWIGQIPVRAILDEELFRAAVDSGLKAVFCGFETVDEKALGNFRKSVPVDGYSRAVRACFDARVFLHAAFIFGMDEHDSSIFDQTLDFIITNSIPSVSTFILTPYPGTPLFERMSGEGRLLHRNWEFYDHCMPVFKPARMSPEELAEGYIRFRESLFSIKSILHRLPAQLRVNPYAYVGMNVTLRRTTAGMREHYNRYFRWLERGAPERTIL